MKQKIIQRVEKLTFKAGKFYKYNGPVGTSKLSCDRFYLLSKKIGVDRNAITGGWYLLECINMVKNKSFGLSTTVSDRTILGSNFIEWKPTEEERNAIIPYLA